jgi:hypothetical protein
MPAADIQLRYPAQAGSPTGSLGLRWANIVNTPLVSATALDNGQEVADVYHLYFHESGGTVTCDVSAGPHTPYEQTGAAVVADDATPNYNLVPGVGLVVDSATITGDRARVSFGAYLTSGGAPTPVLNVGVSEAGAASTEQKVAAVNIGDRDAADCEVIALPGFYYTPYNAQAFIVLVDNHSAVARQALAEDGTLTITFTDWKDAGGGKKSADVMVGGSLAISDAVFDGTTRYEHGHASYDDNADRLKGLAIILADTTADPTSLTVSLVVDGTSHQWVELAADLAGSPGAFAAQTAQPLTETGKSTGTITQTNQADFWHRWNLPDSAALGNLRLWNPRVRGATI